MIKLISEALKDLMAYLKYHKDINHYYNYCLKNCSNFDENAGWRERLDAYRRAE